MVVVASAEGAQSYEEAWWKEKLAKHDRRGFISSFGALRQLASGEHLCGFLHTYIFKAIRLNTIFIRYIYNMC